jgi:hypothetical protein
MNPYIWTKQPSEVRKLEFDPAKALATSDTVTSATAVVYDGDTDVSSTMISGSVIISGNKVYVTIKAGTDGSTYWLRVRAVTTLGDTIEDDLKIVVKQTGK